ncbi:DUF6491 family protein [Sphingomonas sp.]|uniref:DUF6491 family protein n=1 Tax=Sphingomonas sp. TaxID=28214 RepID=UPI001B1ABB60|nr:DUF6491 family protein [Sphingomonas sp.]MBO9713570.1 hypothetical protein [Sphingomonas sp.]
MMRLMALPLAALLGCTASTAMQSEPSKSDLALAKALEGRTAGKAEECISASFTSGPEIIDSKTVLYSEVGRTVWRNDIIGDCPSLKPSETIAIEIHGGQICHNDRFRVIPFGGGIPSAPCRLGKFTPYRKG